MSNISKTNKTKYEDFFDNNKFDSDFISKRLTTEFTKTLRNELNESYLEDDYSIKFNYIDFLQSLFTLKRIALFSLVVVILTVSAIFYSGSAVDSPEKNETILASIIDSEGDIQYLSNDGKWITLDFDTPIVEGMSIRVIGSKEAVISFTNGNKLYLDSDSSVTLKKLGNEIIVSDKSAIIYAENPDNSTEIITEETEQNRDLEEIEVEEPTLSDSEDNRVEEDINEKIQPPSDTITSNENQIDTNTEKVTIDTTDEEITIEPTVPEPKTTSLPQITEPEELVTEEPELEKEIKISYKLNEDSIEFYWETINFIPENGFVIKSDILGENKVITGNKKTYHKVLFSTLDVKAGLSIVDVYICERKNEFDCGVKSNVIKVNIKEEFSLNEKITTEEPPIDLIAENSPEDKIEIDEFIATYDKHSRSHKKSPWRKYRKSRKEKYYMDSINSYAYKKINQEYSN